MVLVVMPVFLICAQTKKKSSKSDPHPPHTKLKSNGKAKT